MNLNLESGNGKVDLGLGIRMAGWGSGRQVVSNAVCQNETLDM